MMKRLLTVMSFATLSLALPAWADETALPPVQHAGQATYISGGIGSDETEVIKAAAKQYPLYIELARLREGGAEYLANVAITIRTPKGDKVMEAAGLGPLVLVKLPAGTYRIEAMANGVQKAQTFQLGKGQKQLALLWPKTE